VVASVRADTADAAVTAAEQVGMPVVIKAAAGQVLHRTDLGAVKLNLVSAAEIRQAVESIKATCGADCPVVVQPMLKGGVETAIGIVNDTTVGPITMFALGGVATDLLADRSFRLPPLDRAGVREQIKSLRASALLFGYRGAAPVDLASLEDLLLRVGQLATDLPELVELDLNPVLAMPDGALAVDVKVRLAPAVADDPYQRRLSPAPSRH
jgi:acyl-CoA synthetase (NDP forming)